MAETAEAPLPPLSSLFPGCFLPGLIPYLVSTSDPSAGDKDTREGNEEKDKPEKE